MTREVAFGVCPGVVAGLSHISISLTVCSLPLHCYRSRYIPLSEILLALLMELRRKEEKSKMEESPPLVGSVSSI
jgi:hypothetical protein